MKKKYFFILLIMLQSYFLIGAISTSRVESKPSYYNHSNNQIKTNANENYEKILNDFLVNHHISSNQMDATSCALSNEKIAIAWVSVYGLSYDINALSFKLQLWVLAIPGNSRSVCSHSPPMKQAAYA